jgi:hypothetical protein
MRKETTPFVSSPFLPAPFCPALRSPAGETREFFRSGLSLQSSINEGYRFTFVLNTATAGKPAGTLVLFVHAPDRRPVSDAQVVFTLLGPGKENLLARAVPHAGGYAVPLPRRHPGACQVEVEVITAGQMLTEHFFFTRKPAG